MSTVNIRVCNFWGKTTGAPHGFGVVGTMTTRMVLLTKGVMLLLFYSKL